ncbi:MAG TPA: hypothetical protein VF765_28660 [Polyangiaceae bacterium]
MGWRRLTWGAALAGSALLGACTNEQGEKGVLGNGSFTYDCTNGQGDSYCSQNGGSEMPSLPNEIAVGAAFAVDYQPNDSAGNGTTGGATGYDITSASMQLALSMGNTVVAQRAGYDALLATHAGTSTVDDFVHVEFVDVASVTPSSPTVQVQAGSSQAVWVEPKDSFGTSMAGRLGCTWSVTSGQAVVSVPSAQQFGAIQVNGMQDGAATVQATCGQVTADVTVTVSGVADGGGGDAGTGDATSGDSSSDGGAGG